MKHLLIIFTLLLTSVSWSKDVDSKDLVQREGHARVPYRHKESDVALGHWANTQRQTYKNGNMSQERIDKLELYKDRGWVWKV